MGGIPVIVLVVFLVIWVLTNVLRAQQDDSRNSRRPVPGQANRPGQAMERNTQSDIDRFLAEIDRLRQRGAPAEEAAAPAGRPAARPAATPPRPRPQARPQPQTTRTQPAPAARTRPSTVVRPTPVPAARVPTPPTTVAAPPPPVTEAPAQPAAGTAAPAPPPSSIHGDLRFAEASRQSTLPVQHGPGGAPSPSLRKPPPKGSAMELVQSMLRGRKGIAAAVFIGEILGTPKSKRR